MASLLVHKSPQQGLTIIGVLVAAMILVAGVVVITQLVAHTSQVAGKAEKRFIAVNLAREGLELVRAQRDNNWFQGLPWTTNICGSFIVSIDPTTGTLIPPQADPTTAQQQLFITPGKTGGFWTHLSSGNQPSGFSRVITSQPLKVVTQQKSPPDDDQIDIVSEDPTDCANANALDITATVSWVDRDTPQSVVIKEKLYDWYFKQ